MEEKEVWAERMYRHLRRLSRLVKQPVSAHTQARFVRMYNAIVRLGLAFHEAQPPFAAMRIGHILVVRLSDFQEAVMRYLLDPD
ncbi:MAG: hypothetical protein ACK59C_01425 [Holosporales bacterium]